jgi:hypothetical protein
LFVQKKLYFETINQLFYFQLLNYKLLENGSNVILSFPIISETNIIRYNLKLINTVMHNHEDYIIINMENIPQFSEIDIMNLLIADADIPTAITKNQKKIIKNPTSIKKQNVIDIKIQNNINCNDKFDITKINKFIMKKQLDGCSKDIFDIHEFGLDISYIRKNILLNCINSHFPIYYSINNKVIQSKNYLNLNNTEYWIYDKFIQSLIDDNIIKYHKSLLNANNDNYEIICNLHPDFLSLNFENVKNDINYFNDNFSLSYDKYHTPFNIKIYPSITFINNFNNTKKHNVKVGFRIYESVLDLEFFIYPFKMNIENLNKFDFKRYLNEYLLYLFKSKIDNKKIKKYCHRLNDDILNYLLQSEYKFNNLSLYFIIEHLLFMSVYNTNYINDLNKQLTSEISEDFELC